MEREPCRFGAAISTRLLQPLAPVPLRTVERRRQHDRRPEADDAAERASARNPERTAEIYATALEVEPLAEEVYRRLMASLAAQGRHAEALDVHRRCRQMLSVVLGVAPSRETEALHQSITKAA
jgi:DNA-binding SARP family transcriptional activator